MLARALSAQPNVTALLSLSNRVQLPPDLARCELPVDTYDTMLGYVGRLLRFPVDLIRLRTRVKALAPDFAICAMPGPLDLLMAAALRLLGVGFVVLVHDAEAHPGDGWPFQMTLQRWLCRSATTVGALTDHVAASLRRQGLVDTPDRPLIKVTHPPLTFGIDISVPRVPGPRRLLCFGRLLAYKGLDLLGDALPLLGPRHDFELRVVGTGPESPVLDRLRSTPSVTVENRWVPEDEVGPLLAWSDALILPYREASQSGVAAAALAAGRQVVATRVGGLVEQLEGHPGAILCNPSPLGLAQALRELLDMPPARITPQDSNAAWDAMAACLLVQIRPLIGQVPG
jgi:glycosyltransferase involved in cell wall biosynthesis